MSIFGKPKAGGFMDEIRCDEAYYLIWKWHPNGSVAGNNNRENAIRLGSSLRVKDGEVAVFVYNQPDGIMQEYIEGPADRMIETENFPVLASILGLAYDGGTPFQAEIYFINLAQIIQVPFAVPYFDIYDPRFLDFGVPTAIRGKMTFNIKDYRSFIKLHRLNTFDLEAFQNQIRAALARYVKNVVANVPAEEQVPVVQIERYIGKINNVVEQNIRKRFEQDFGINVMAVDISAIDVDKTSDAYRQLKSVTQDVSKATIQAQTEINIKNMKDMQEINAENTSENLRIKREEAQYAQRKQTQSANMDAFKIEKQAEVAEAGAEALGNMGTNGATEVSAGGIDMNPAGMMAGMAMGGAIGQNMANMMNDVMQNINSPSQVVTPPPIQVVAYHIVINGEAAGPFDMQTLYQMVCKGELTKDTLVWKNGMTDWVKAGTIQELNHIIDGTSKTPPIPTKDK